MLAFAVLHLGGCAGGGERTAPADRPEFARPDVSRPVVEGNQQGLEVRIWAIEGQEDFVAQLLDSYGGRPTPMLDSDRQAWRQSGFRVLSVPLDELNLARGGLRLVGPEQQDWFGVFPDWRAAVEGRRVAGGTLLALADGLLRVPAGRLRLLARSWVIPGDSGAVMQTELAVVLHPEGPGTLNAFSASPSPDEPGVGGVRFPELRSSFVMRKDEAIVLVPVGPGFDAGRLIDPSRMGEAALEVGPPAPGAPTVGEAMLTSADLRDEEGAHRRAIVVLIARLPETYRLLSAQLDGEPWN